MINDFDALFPLADTGHEIPPSLLSAMNNQVAPHYEYECKGDGVFTLKTTGEGVFSIGGTNPRFAVVDGSQEVFTTDDYGRAEAFARNALLPIHIHFDRWKTTLDGVEHDGQMIVRTPYFEMRNQRLIIPAPAPIELDLSMGIDRCSHNFHFVQIPSFNEAVRQFNSKGDYPLEIAYEIDTSSYRLSMRINISSSKAASARQFYEALRIYDAIIHGDGEIDGTPLGPIALSDEKPLPKSLLSVYKMASELEILLQVTFVPSAGIERKSYHNLARLYCMLVLGRALWLPQRASSWIVSESPINDALPCPLSAIIIKVEEIELFGVTFTFYGYSKLADAMVISVNQLEDGTYKLFFDDSLDSPPNYAEFLTSTDSSSYENDDIDKVNEAFMRAENLVDILREEGLI